MGNEEDLCNGKNKSGAKTGRKDGSSSGGGQKEMERLIKEKDE